MIIDFLLLDDRCYFLMGCVVRVCPTEFGDTDDLSLGCTSDGCFMVSRTRPVVCERSTFSFHVKSYRALHEPPYGAPDNNRVGINVQRNGIFCSQHMAAEAVAKVVNDPTCNMCTP